MAVRHFAYGFKPQNFIAELRTCCHDRGQLQVRKLHDCAQRTLENRTDAIDEALIALRYGETWIDGAEDEADVAEKWFVLALLKHLHKVPSLGRARPMHHVVLRALLPGTRWAGADIHRLIYGDGLASILCDSQIVVEPGTFAALPDYAGWLSGASVFDLQQKLTAVRGALMNLSQDQKRCLEQIFPAGQVDSAEVCQQAYESGQRMLGGAIRKKQALFLVLD